MYPWETAEFGGVVDASRESYGGVTAIPDRTNSGIFNFATGILSKAADTALDIYTLEKELERRERFPGTVYPSGQVDPESVPEANRTNGPGQVSNQDIANAIRIGVVVIGVVGAVYILTSRARSK